MTPPLPQHPLPPLCEMARLWISMAADGEANEVERAALDEHLEFCDDCSEWRALAETLRRHRPHQMRRRLSQRTGRK